MNEQCLAVPLDRSDKHHAPHYLFQDHWLKSAKKQAWYGLEASWYAKDREIMPCAEPARASVEVIWFQTNPQAFRLNPASACLILHESELSLSFRVIFSFVLADGRSNFEFQKVHFWSDTIRKSTSAKILKRRNHSQKRDSEKVKRTIWSSCPRFSGAICESWNQPSLC